ncbi:hypothetical protein F7O81_10115 [Neisseria meningitidis]|nr:hypothetical protein [Neisseria meningitidis]MBG8817527.1 hypothetical protein [Neisseria meningitidis]MBG8822621.1 hypothetical protein [Neisseria meningitidis]MBG8823535.1 hypothetical protein [Neisseria meningitidis]MBG8826340.1 hypothetical protein [Neisseria meningitidis]
MLRLLKSRHSRAGGNPVRSVSVVSDKSCSVGFLDSRFRGNDGAVGCRLKLRHSCNFSSFP